MALAQSPNSTNESDRSQIAQALSESQKAAALLTSDLASLDFIVRVRAGTALDQGTLEAFAGHIDDLRNQAAKLESLRSSGASSQQSAVDRILPVMREFASSAEAAISEAKAAPQQSNATAFRQYIRLNSELAGEFSKAISAWVSYAQTRGALDRVAREIGAPAGPQ